VFLWAQEAPQIVARFGAEVLPTVLEILDDLAAPAMQRGAAAATLGFLATTTPELRAQIVTELRDHLAHEEDATVTDTLLRRWLSSTRVRHMLRSWQLTAPSALIER
jgi:hypothetical protein